MSTLKRHDYASRKALAEALATGTAAVLAGGLATRGTATLAVSGGSTPRLFLQHLSQAEIDWASVDVLLVDERWVPADSERSNAAFVTRNLLQGPAAAARFEPIYEPGLTAREGAEALNRRFHSAPSFDAVVLGMGTDGHTASFFSGADRLSQAIDPDAATLFEAVEAPGAGEPRVTLTLPVLLSAQFLALHIEGADKLATLERAQGNGAAEEMPVRAVLQGQRERALEIFWAP